MLINVVHKAGAFKRVSGTVPYIGSKYLQISKRVQRNNFCDVSLAGSDW